MRMKQARDGELVAEEPHAGVRPLAAGLELDAALVRQLEVGRGDRSRTSIVAMPPVAAPAAAGRPTLAEEM